MDQIWHGFMSVHTIFVESWSIIGFWLHLCCLIWYYQCYIVLYTESWIFFLMIWEGDLVLKRSVSLDLGFKLIVLVLQTVMSLLDSIAAVLVLFMSVSWIMLRIVIIRGIIPWFRMFSRCGWSQYFHCSYFSFLISKILCFGEETSLNNFICMDGKTFARQSEKWQWKCNNMLNI